MTIRLVGFMRRLPQVSFEDFDRMWTDHGVLVASLPTIKSGLVKYKQFHLLPQMNGALKSAGFPVAQYDGVAEWEAQTVDEILDIFRSEEYQKNIFPDEANFFHREVVQVMVGQDKTDFGLHG